MANTHAAHKTQNNNGLPKGVPAENEYFGIHWAVVVAYAVAAGALYMLVSAMLTG